MRFYNNANLINNKIMKMKLIKIVCTFLIVIILLLPSEVAFAQEQIDWQEFETEHFIIKHHDLDEGTLLIIADEAENAYDKVTSDLRYQPDNKTVIRIGINDSRQSGGDAYYSPSFNYIDLYSPSQKYGKNYESYVRRSVRHEFTHHILTVGYRFMLPDWLHEGIALFEAGTKPQQIHGYKKFKRNIKNNDLLPLGKMVIFDFLKEDERNLAYIESYTIVEYTVDEYGYDGLVDILNARKESTNMKQVINNSLGISLEEFELGWKNFVKEKYGQSITEYILIAYIFIILVVSYVKFIRVKYQNK